MRRPRRLNTGGALATLAILAAFFRAAPAEDRLEPETGLLNSTEWQIKYESRVRAVLFREATTYYLARVVCLTAGDEGEWVVTVVRKCEGSHTPDHKDIYALEYAGAEEYLQDRETVRGVKVKKARVDLDSATAEAVEEVWRRMLRSARYPKKRRALVEDAETFHFSRAVPVFHQGHEDPLYGFESGQAWAPSVAGGLTAELIEIGKSMKALAIARPEDRKRVGEEMNSKTVRLKALLDRSQPPD